MYFKKLELIGFKSFSDKTTIEFEPGVTAIVGPNGCGKSNIADAIRWVLGEQSAKSLRGSSMEDVIFNGSASKDALNLAEVSLTLSNESKILPIDYEEVTLTRRLYRSGESEYLINKNPVRLKDVQELIMGTGIGTDSYCIFEQGKMDLILNSKPEERREIFEEAAGITKFKSKKKEAIRKLEQTDANLLRINDITSEVKRSIGSVERQARKAENYKTEFEKLKKLELALAAQEFSNLENKKKDTEANLQSLRAKENEFLSQVGSIEATIEVQKSQIEDLDNTIKQAQAKDLQFGGEIQRSKDRMALNHERLSELSERKGELAKQIEMGTKRIEELAREVETLTIEFEALGDVEAEGLSFLNSVEAGFSSIEDFIRDSFAQEQSLKTDLVECAKRRAQVQTELAKIQAERHGLGIRAKHLKEEEAVVLKEIEEVATHLESSLGITDLDSQTLGPRLAAQVRTFRNKLKEFIQRLYEKFVAQEKKDSWLDAGEEVVLESEIKGFAQQLLEAQAQSADEKGKIRHAEEQKKKCVDRLSFLQLELSDLSAELQNLSERERRIQEEIAGQSGVEKGLNGQVKELENQRRAKAQEKETLLVRLTQTRSEQTHRTANREKIQKDKNWAVGSKENEANRLAVFRSEESERILKQQALENENLSLESEVARLGAEREKALKTLERLSLEKQAALVVLVRVEKERSEKQSFLKTASDQTHALEMESAQMHFQMHSIKERIFNAYQLDLAPESIEQFPLEMDTQEAVTQAQAQKEKLAKIGPVNLVAIQEFDEMKERFDFLSRQQQDLLQAKEDLHKAILKINRTTKELFVQTFEKIREYFSEYFRLLFGGGSAELLLLDETDVLESGIDMIARPTGKKLQNISLLSGGEKALTAIALLFALFKVRPSPFCVLDEIDAPLDESNVDRFCGVLKEFIKGSQFILITHNKRTMSLADVLYGITMSETGISKIVSVKFGDKKLEKASEEEKTDTKEALVS